jgi:hypothetical protein
VNTQQDRNSGKRELAAMPYVAQGVDTDTRYSQSGDKIRLRGEAHY